jgi:hypothetical protein
VRNWGQALLSEAGSARLVPALIVLAVAAVLAGYIVPRGFEAQALLAIKDDPAAIADRALDLTFTSATAEREIEAALAVEDADLAQSFVDLAVARQVAIDPVLAALVGTATAEQSSARHQAQNFARGLVTGVPDDVAGFAGTALGDLFVFGDVRDIAREVGHLALGEPADKLIMGLAAAGIAITAGTYATVGVTAPVRAGLTLLKVARTTGRFGTELAGVIGRLLRQAVDLNRLRRAIVGGSLARPALAVHAARDAVKVERAGGLLHFVRDTGRIERKAGTQAALDSLKVAQNPAEMARVAELAETKGSKTRAILKLLGRGAIALGVASFDLVFWMLCALVAVVSFVSSLKAATERITWRILRRRKARRQPRQDRLIALAVADSRSRFGTMKIAQ